MRNASDTVPSRRTFLRLAAGGAGVALIPSALAGLVSACTDTAIVGESGVEGGRVLAKGALEKGGYGELVPNANGIVSLPNGFQCRTFGAIGDPMSDGGTTPVALDGMAAFHHARGRSRTRLLRNHEDRNGPIPAIGLNPYDPMAGGGVVTLEIGADRRLDRDFVSLSGTAVNCAGGPTPWGTWLSCEETVAGTAEGFLKPHGYVFEVPSWIDGPVADPVPLVALGRFSHEAVAVDPADRVIYLTEDNGFSEGRPDRPGSGFYRFIPVDPSGKFGSLQKGGRLQMLKVVGEPNHQAFRGGAIGDAYDVEWVDIPDPDPASDTDEYGVRMTAVFYQGYAQGAAAFSRLEGCWYGEGSIFFNDTSGGAAGVGQVWQYVPGRRKLVLVFESPGPEVLDSPDNITLSPRGGVVLCEDGDGVQYVRGLTPGGSVFDLVRNDLNDAEFAGACFSPDGQTLFVNIQGPTRGTPAAGAGQGTTIAIWGPWESGAT